MQSSSAVAAPAQESAEPRGTHIGVSFDWGWVLQLFINAIMAIAGVSMATMGTSNWSSVASLVFVGILALVLGQGLRLGRGWAWYIQVGLNGLLTLGGLALLPTVIQQVQAGMRATLSRLAAMFQALNLGVLLMPVFHQLSAPRSPGSRPQ